jgi:pyruvate/2-oxoglutarate dehydrogenase complex dihydrolipoamide acyltransferase (E2) component
MAPPKKPYSQLRSSAKYYRDHPKAAEKKKKTDKKVNARPEQRKKRNELKKARRAAQKRGVNLRGKDMSHTKDGRIVPENSSRNRARQGANGKSTKK